MCKGPELLICCRIPLPDWNCIPGIFLFLQKTSSPRTWSICSCVTKIALIFSGAEPTARSEEHIARQLTPASIRSSVPPWRTSVQFPLEPEKREKICVFIYHRNQKKYSFTRSAAIERQSEKSTTESAFLALLRLGRLSMNFCLFASFQSAPK